ncbi:hypothetical protein A0H81_01767 [Grifola frondosa]|uniref:Uncharacterized protein n=1 Tax=Grifola frondosa TaxID=5627 RepID=A0A1C7ML11_GRIFR|nr:hypothetical protein A0H81_01767 [Grifola frondosa]
MESPQGVADPLRTSGNLRPADSSRPAASSTFTLAANRDAHQGSSLASNPYFYTTRPGPSNSLMSESAAERRRRISQDAIFSHRFGSNASGVDMSGGSHADPTTRRMLSFDPETDQPASHSSLQRSAVFHQLRWPWDQVANELQTNSASVPSQHIDGYIPSRRALPGGSRRLRDDEDISPFGLPHELSNPSGDQSNASEVALSFDDLSSYPSGRDFDRDYYSMEMDSSNSHASYAIPPPSQLLSSNNAESFGRSARSANPPSSRVAEHPLPYSSIVTDIPPWGQIMNDPSLESSSHADRVAYEDEDCKPFIEGLLVSLSFAASEGYHIPISPSFRSVQTSSFQFVHKC